jgi:hypothetical protein
MIAALLPVAAAMTPEADSTANVPMAITQPLGTMAATPFAGDGQPRPVPECGLIVLVGSGLLGLAAVVRRTTGV